MATLVKVFFYASDPAELLEAGYDRIRVEFSADRGATWSPRTTASTELAIQEDKHNYVYVDPNGSMAYKYRAVLRASDDSGDPVDLPQAAQDPVDTAYEAVWTIDELKSTYLFGVDLTDDEGKPFPDLLFAHYIQQGIARMEHELDMALTPREVSERHDLYRRDVEQFFFLSLYKRPVISVGAVRIEYPSGRVVIEYPTTWVHLDKHAGTIQLMPDGALTPSSLLLQGNIFSLFHAADMLPGMIVVEYRAGFELGKIPADIRDLVGKFAAIGPLNIAGDLVAGAGIQSSSLSIDGLSRSITTSNSSTNAGYGARLVNYQKEMKEALKTVKRYYNGTRMTVV